MGETMEPENAAFWLPTHFLTDDDFLSDDLHLCKPNPNNLDIFSTLDSPVSSTETEKGDTNTNDDAVNKDLDDDDFLAELTRHLANSSLNDSNNSSSQKPWVFSTSPQSTLSGFGPWSNRSGFSSNGSPNGPSRVPSPPVTPPPKTDAAWDLLYEAAGQVARLKINALAAQFNQQQQQQQNRGLLGVPAPRNGSLSSKSHHHLNSFYDYPSNPPQFEAVKRQQGSGNFYCQHHQRRTCGGGPLGLPQSAWPTLRPNHHRQPTAGTGMRAAFHNGPVTGTMPGMKRQSAGTGVFLPRRAGTPHQPPPPVEGRKKPNGNNTPAMLPARVVQALNLDLEEINNGVNANPHSRFGGRMLSDHDIMVARRNAILEQQRRSLISRNEAMVGHHEIRLPSDWTY